jgi:hypothetical protein
MPPREKYEGKGEIRKKGRNMKEREKHERKRET